MKREPLFNRYKFIRQWQYAWLCYFWHLQSYLFGDMPEIIYSKSWFSLDDDKSFLGKMFKKFRSPKPKIPEFKQDISINNIDFSTYDKDIFDFLNQNWNEVYESQRQKGSVLGAIAEYLIGKGEKPSHLEKLSINQLDGLLKDKYNLPTLENYEKLMDETGLRGTQFYSYMYAKDKGAEWLAIYDQNGQRSGKAYDTITKMYRAIVAESIKQGKTVGELKTNFVFPGIDSLKKDYFDKEELNKEEEQEFQSLIEKHLNRDMIRFAITDSSIAINNGKVLQGLAEGKRYVKFSR